MANLKNIRSQIKSVTSIQKVTKAMKMVAAAKLRKSQENMEKARPYSERLKILIADLINDVDRSLMPLLDKHSENNKIGFVIVTGDRGLAGSFNTNIIKKAEKEIAKIGKENAKLFCIGKKGYEHFYKRDYSIINHYKDFWMNLAYSQAINIGDDIISAYVNKKIDSVEVVYNYFKNVGSQKLIHENLLPLDFEKTENTKNTKNTDIIFEPSKVEIVKSLVPKYFNTQIWQYLLESFASEQAARMLAMENATENAKDMINDLNLEFNKARQTAITTEMLEIVGGAEALSN
jgi:F-type H+-transporting ATPase subunit gamma